MWERVSVCVSFLWWRKQIIWFDHTPFQIVLIDKTYLRELAIDLKHLLKSLYLFWQCVFCFKCIIINWYYLQRKSNMCFYTPGILNYAIIWILVIMCNAGLNSRGTISLRCAVLAITSFGIYQYYVLLKTPTRTKST